MVIDAAAVVDNAHATVFVANTRVVVDIFVIMMLMVYVSKVNTSVGICCVDSRSAPSFK